MHHRVFLAALAVAGLALAGCGSSEPQRSASCPLPGDKPFSDSTAHQTACGVLFDHAVTLFADRAVSEEMSDGERDAFRRGWARELDRRGSHHRFNAACMRDLTPSRFQCGMSASTPEELSSCLNR